MQNGKGVKINNYNKLLGIFEESFNFKLSFSTMSKKEFYKFIKDFMNNKTEYYQDDYFLNNYYKEVKKLMRKEKII